MQVDFHKMHGAGNDFVVLDARKRALPLAPARIAALADRRRGIGFDQLVLLQTDEPDATGAADVRVRFFNPDGSEAGACGNASRCVGRLLSAELHRPAIRLRTAAGLLEAVADTDGTVTVDMGAPRFGWDTVPLAREGDTLRVVLDGLPPELPPGAALSMGNPHCSFFLPTAAAVDPVLVGPVVERHPMFPERVNAGFAVVEAPDRLRLRVWERGAGLTLACGSGACAAAVNAHRLGLCGRAVTVELDGGVLGIEWRASDDHVLMSGPAVLSFSGRVELEEFAA
ncbi:diaminopimelate epimerase [Rhizosaccharibacter radicis]|uniref:Diaminopimelate epimerase n=1 Tax=Rhizosaccharibacter radicis TaxID=2782605 RepID=A0ABT1VZ52_9PROT|nr:diaminopimelate epimerase [Acetobacteraceae bacterium KSS12]